MDVKATWIYISLSLFPVFPRVDVGLSLPLCLSGTSSLTKFRKCRSIENENGNEKGRKVTRPGDRPDQIRPGRTGRSRSHEIGEFNNLLRGRGGGEGEGEEEEEERVEEGKEGRVAIISRRYRSLIRHAARGNARLDLS